MDGVGEQRIKIPCPNLGARQMTQRRLGNEVGSFLLAGSDVCGGLHLRNHRAIWMSREGGVSWGLGDVGLSGGGVGWAGW